MIGNLGDFLVVVVVFILLMAGDKNAAKNAKSIGKFLGELRRRQNEFKNELMRELNSIDEDEKVVQYKYVRDLSQDRVKELEMKIKQLQEELQRLKNSGGKN
ncbi:MAG: hypothetical protein QXO77_00660 [Saccharolobus sp.]